MGKEVPENGRVAYGEGYSLGSNPHRSDHVKWTRWNADWWNTNANTMEANYRIKNGEQPRPTQAELKTMLSGLRLELASHGGTGDYIVICPIHAKTSPDMPDGVYSTIFLSSVDKSAAAEIMGQILNDIDSHVVDYDPTVN